MLTEAHHLNGSTNPEAGANIRGLMTQSATLDYRISSRSGSTLRVLLTRQPGQASRPVLLSIHGLHGSAEGNKNRAFREVLLAGGFDFCAFDLTGHGESSGSLEHCTFADLVSDAAAVVAFLAETYGDPDLPLGVLGSSMGARVAWFLALQEPRVQRLYLMAPLLDVQASSLNPGPDESGTPLFQTLAAGDAYQLPPHLPPVCLVHGRNDVLLPYPATERLHRLLTEHGTQAELHFTEADHQFSLDSDRQFLCDLALRWFSR